MCTQRKSLAQLRNHSIMCQKCCIFLSRFFQALQSCFFFLKIDAAFPFVFVFPLILCFASILCSSLSTFPIKPRGMRLFLFNNLIWNRLWHRQHFLVWCAIEIYPETHVNEIVEAIFAGNASSMAA